MGTADADILAMTRQCMEAFGREVSLIVRATTGRDATTMKPVVLESEAVTINAFVPPNTRGSLSGRGTDRRRVYSLLVEDLTTLGVAPDTVFDVLKDGDEEWEIHSASDDRCKGLVLDLDCSRK